VAEQLLLNIQLREHTTFANFVAGGNELLLDSLQRSASGRGEQFTYLWGPHGVGRTHLLQASCHKAGEFEQQAFYLSLADYKTMSPAVLRDLETLHLVCLDDIDCIAEDAMWEEALFHLYNRIRQGRTHLIVSAGRTPNQLDIKLADLTSRLAWGLVLQVQLLSDASKLQALQLRAEQRGFSMPDAVGNFLLNHCARALPELFAILERLDHACIAEQRRLTIPFVKQALNL